MTLRGVVIVALALAVALVASCARDAPSGAPLTWAIAIHGGAGTIDPAMPAAVREAYTTSLQTALAHGADLLRDGRPALDVVEGVVAMLEDDPRFNAGRGAVFTAEGRHELDASIMDGATLGCGAVAGVTTVRNPVKLARLVMAKTRHVLLAGDGAERFADTVGVERVANGWFDTDERRRKWEEWRARDAAGAASVVDGGVSPAAFDAGVDQKKGTVGAVALDVHGHLAAATSTGGLTGKRWGRVGDSPVVGAGTYADDRTAAVSCTGTGEEFIRNAVAHTVSSRIALLREDAETAARGALATLKPDDGGLIVVDGQGRIAMVFNTPGMYRGAADSTGRFEVGIWADTTAGR